MAETNWHVEGDYFETCNCDFLCPCLPSNMAAPPTHGECKVAIVFHVTKGSYGETALDDLTFVVAAHTPGVMADGNWTVGLIVDERADEAQQEAIGAIASGEAGGPMSALGPLIGNFAGMELKPITFEKNGMSCSISIPGMLEQGLVGAASAMDENQPLMIENTIHPANPRLALARATHSHLHAFGIDWDDDSGRNNGHFAPFNWQSN